MSKVSVIQECLARVRSATSTMELIEANHDLRAALDNVTIKELLDVVELADQYLNLPDDTPAIRRLLARNLLEKTIAKVKG